MAHCAYVWILGGSGGEFELLHALHLLAEVVELFGGAALLEGLLGVDYVIFTHDRLQVF